MPKDKNKSNNKFLAKALKATNGGATIAKKEGGNNLNKPATSNSRSTVAMGGSASSGGGGGGSVSRAKEVEEQLRILKERQLGKKNPGYVMKTKKKAAVPVLAPSALGGISFGGGGIFGNASNIATFKPPVTSEEASRNLVSSLLEGESDSSRAKPAPVPQAKVSTGQSVVRNTFAALEDHSQTGTPGVSLKPATFSLAASRFNLPEGSLSSFQSFQGFQGFQGS